ncbi:hypothetical protein TNCV_4109421 [Trichonephila clavipes]|nr:hypothetical protein TNCV_4109421 [Trichonephila clavipes]
MRVGQRCPGAMIQYLDHWATAALDLQWHQGSNSWYSRLELRTINTRLQQPQPKFKGYCRIRPINQKADSRQIGNNKTGISINFKRHNLVVEAAPRWHHQLNDLHSWGFAVSPNHPNHLVAKMQPI